MLAMVQEEMNWCLCDNASMKHVVLMFLFEVIHAWETQKDINIYRNLGVI